MGVYCSKILTCLLQQKVVSLTDELRNELSEKEKLKEQHATMTSSFRDKKVSQLQHLSFSISVTYPIGDYMIWNIN